MVQNSLGATRVTNLFYRRGAEGAEQMDGRLEGLEDWSTSPSFHVSTLLPFSLCSLCLCGRFYSMGWFRSVVSL